MNLQNRLRNLEKHSGEGREPCWMVVCNGEAKPTETDIEAAREAYKTKHPNWRLQQNIVLPVGYSAGHPLIEMLEMIESGEWPPK